jgi:membrane protein involved in colicin uptake
MDALKLHHLAAKRKAERERPATIHPAHLRKLDQLRAIRERNAAAKKHNAAAKKKARAPKAATAKAKRDQINRILAEHADAIRFLGRRAVMDIFEIGRRLTGAKKLAGHGGWLKWLKREFGWTAKTAERFISVYELGSEIDNLSNLEIPVSGLYLLAQKR